MRIVLLALAVLSLAACTPGGSSIHFSDYPRYSGSIGYYAARDGRMPVSIFGNPTGADTATFHAAVADGLAGTHFMPETVFVPTPRPLIEGYRAVLVFGGATAETICEIPPEQATGPGANPSQQFAGAFCLDDGVLSFTSGQYPSVTDPRDPALRRFLRGIGYELFPPYNPQRDSDDDVLQSHLLAAPGTGG